jgi:hypothetical protein
MTKIAIKGPIISLNSSVFLGNLIQPMTAPEQNNADRVGKNKTHHISHIHHKSHAHQRRVWVLEHQLPNLIKK